MTMDNDAIELDKCLTHYDLITSGEKKGAFLFNPKHERVRTYKTTYSQEQVMKEGKILREGGYSVVTPNPERSLEMKAFFDDIENTRNQ